MYDYLQDPQVKESFLGGLVGGPIQESITTLTGSVGDIFRRQEIKDYNNNLAVKQAESNAANKQFVDSRMKFTTQKMREKQEAILSGREQDVKAIDEGLFSSLVYSNAKNQNVHNLEQNLKDIASSKDAPEEERTKATELLSQLPKYEREFIKATEASTVVGEDGTSKVDELKRANLFSLATRIESTKSAMQEMDKELTGFNSDRAKIAAKEAEIDRLEKLRPTAEKIDSYFTTPEGSLSSGIKAFTNALPTIIGTAGGGILSGTEGAMAGTAAGMGITGMLEAMMDKNLTTKKLDSLVAKKQSELEILKSNATATGEELSSKDNLDIKTLAAKRAEFELLHNHYNDTYSALKTNKKDLSEKQANLLAQLNSDNADDYTTNQVDTILKQEGIRTAPAVNTEEVSQEPVAQSDVQLESLANRFVRDGRGIETDDEAQVISANPDKFQELLDKVDSEVQAENAYKQEQDEVRDTLINSLGGRSQLEEGDVNDFVEAAKDKDINTVVGQLNNIRRDALEGNVVLPETTTDEDFVESIDKLLKGLNLEPQEPLSKAYDNVNHWEDYKSENEQDAYKNNADGFQELRKLKSVNAVAYNGTNPAVSEVEFANYVQNPNNNIVGQRVEYVVPEQIGVFAPDEMKAWTMVQNKSWNKSKANRDFVMTNLPIQIRLDNGMTSWLHKPSYEGYSDNVEFRKALNEFNTKVRPAIITALLTGKKVSTTVKNQRPGYGNYQFWYGNPKSKTIVNTQNAEEMAAFRRELANNPKTKRTPVYNRITSVVAKVELAVANKLGAIGNNTGKTAGRVYFKVRKGNGEIGWAPAYVRSINDRVELIRLMKENPAEALIKFEEDMKSIGKLLNKSPELLTEKDVLSILVEEPSKVYSMTSSEAVDYLEGKRTEVDANRLTDPNYVEFLTQGSDPILYTNMAKYSANGVNALYVQPTIELDTAFSINETISNYPIVTEELSDVEYQELVAAQVDGMNIQDPALKADVRISLLLSNREQLAKLDNHFKVLDNPKASLKDVDLAVRDLSSVFTKAIGGKLAAGALYNNYKESAADRDAITKRYKGLAKDFDTLINLVSYFNQNKPVERLINSGVSNIQSTDKVPTTSQNSPISVYEDVIDNLVFESVISGNPLNAVTGEDEQSVSITNQLSNPNSELSKVVKLRVAGIEAKLKELGVSKSTAKVLIDRNNSIDSNFELLRSAITSTDKPLTDEPDSYYRDAVSDKIKDVELKQAIKNLSRE